MPAIEPSLITLPVVTLTATSSSVFTAPTSRLLLMFADTTASVSASTDELLLMLNALTAPADVTDAAVTVPVFTSPLSTRPEQDTFAVVTMPVTDSDSDFTLAASTAPALVIDPDTTTVSFTVRLPASATFACRPPSATTSFAVTDKADTLPLATTVAAFTSSDALKFAVITLDTAVRSMPAIEPSLITLPVVTLTATSSSVFTAPTSRLLLMFADTTASVSASTDELLLMLNALTAPADVTDAAVTMPVTDSDSDFTLAASTAPALVI